MAWRLGLIAGALAISAVTYLWPLEFVFPRYSVANSATLADHSLSFERPGIVIDAAGGALIHRALSSGDAFTIAVSAEASDIDQDGPARFVSQSTGILTRNFMLGQDAGDLVFRVRTPVLGDNGDGADFRAKGVIRPGVKQFLVASYAPDGVRLYVDGQMAADIPFDGGALVGWDPSFPIVFGNELTGDRPWRGRLYDVALYDAAFPPDRVFSLTAGSTDIASDDVYRLSSRCFRPQGNGQARAGEFGRCTVPPILEVAHPVEILALKRRFPSDIAQRLLLWIPIGFLVQAIFLSRRWPFPILVVCGWAASLEFLQVFVPARSSTLLDLCIAILAGYLGILARRRFVARRESDYSA
ncbi:MAG: LamG-like jellyroll fold domain-containing protein [Pseudomonadota bacterium]